MLRNLLAGYPLWAAGTMALSVALALAYLAAEMACWFVRATLHRWNTIPTPPGEAPVRGGALRVLRLTVFLAAVAVLFSPALKVAGLDLHVGYEPETVVSWVLASGVRVVLIVLLAALVVRATSAAVTRLESDIGRAQTAEALERARRVRTLGTLVENTVGTFAMGTALLMILRELNVDVLPLLTGAGIAGLAIGFGAQTLVKDIISGFFMILENQVRVGDVAVINGVGGVVESMKLRTVTLRDAEGAVHVFPNGSVTTLANKTKDFSYAVLDLAVSYREDTDAVIATLRTIGEQLRADADLGPFILEDAEVLGIESLNESTVTLRIRFKTLPLKQWDVARELRRRVKDQLTAQGIDMAVPQRAFLITGQGEQKTEP